LLVLVKRAVLLGVAAALLAPAGALAQTPELQESPDGQLLVVNNNLEEAFIAEDVADPSDMENFVDRLLARVPYLPDVLLVQEVVDESAENVADLMSSATGSDYVVLISPGVTVYEEGEPNEQVIRDPAIIINAGTVRGTGPRGYVTTSYAAEDGLPGEPVRTKERAYAGIEELSSGVSHPVMSLHFVPNRNAFVDEETAFAYKEQWSDEMTAFLDQTFPPSDWGAPLIVGDFNNRRCPDPDETRDCDALPFWNTMTATQGYTDAIFSGGSEAEIGTLKRIDYMFGRTGFVQAASDLDYGPVERADPAIFYSDHRLMWSLTAS
jgi:hypothetical protein